MLIFYLMEVRVQFLAAQSYFSFIRCDHRFNVAAVDWLKWLKLTGVRVKFKRDEILQMQINPFFLLKGNV